MLEPPVEVGRQQRQRPQQNVVALLLDRPADAEDDDGIGRDRCRPAPAALVEGAEAVKVEPVIAQMHAALPSARGCRCS